MGLFNLFDFSKKSSVLKAKELIRTERPRWAHASPPCSPFSALQNGRPNTIESQEKLMKVRKWGRRVMRNTLE
eukprot:9167303-Pyramimonas_sp.AAC.1